jgi:hypothetical protein
MRNHAGGTSKGKRETFVALVTIVTLAVTIMVGVMATSLRAQSAGSQASSLKRQEWETLAGGKMTFDVASVKPSKITSLGLGTSNVPLGPGDTYPPNGGLFSAKHFTLIYFVMFAYKITSINDLRGIRTGSQTIILTSRRGQRGIRVKIRCD